MFLRDVFCMVCVVCSLVVVCIVCLLLVVGWSLAVVRCLHPWHCVHLIGNASVNQTRLCITCRLLRVERCVWFVAGWLFDVCGVLIGVLRLTFVMCSLLYVVRCSLLVVCWLLFLVCCLPGFCCLWRAVCCPLLDVIFWCWLVNCLVRCRLCVVNGLLFGVLVHCLLVVCCGRMNTWLLRAVFTLDTAYTWSLNPPEKQARFWIICCLLRVGCCVICWLVVVCCKWRVDWCVMIDVCCV